MRAAVVEILDRDGTARRIVPIAQWPATIGRAVDCDVVLDDPHAAAHHATIDETDGVLSIRIGDSVNGASWPGTHLTSGGAATLPAAQVFHLGATRLRVRRASDSLAGEERLVPEPAASRVPLAALILLLLGWTVFWHWLRLNTGSRATEYMEVVIPGCLMLALWSGAWALASKIFRHRFEFWLHLRIAVVYILLSNLVEIALPALSYMTGPAFFSRIAWLVSAAVLCAMVVAHLARVLPARRRLAAAIIGALYATGVVIELATTYQSQDRLFSEPYVATLAPPALRLAPTVPPATFIEEARGLKDALAAHINDDDGNDFRGFGPENALRSGATGRSERR